MRPGEWFGTASALLERGRRITAVARTDVHLLRVPGDELRGRPAALGEQALGVRSGSRHVFRNPGLASGARNALQRVQEHVQPRRGRVLAPATGGAQLQVADRDRTRAPARYCGFRLRTSRRFRRGAPEIRRRITPGSRTDQSGSLAGIQPQPAKRLRMQLAALDSARVIENMDIPGLQLHRLHGLSGRVLGCRCFANPQGPSPRQEPHSA